MITRLKKLAVINPANGDVTILSNFLEGGEGSTAVNFEHTPEGKVIEDGQPRAHRANSKIVMAGYPSTSASIRSRLFGYVENQTDVRFAGVGIDGMLVTDQDFILSFGEGFNEDSVSWMIEAMVDHKHGWSASTSKAYSNMHFGANGLMLYNFLDSDSNNAADGYTSFGFVSLGFSSGVQNLTHSDADSTNRFFRDIVFPFPGQTVTLSVTVDIVNTVSNYTHEIEIEAFDFADSSLGSNATAFSTDGRKTVSYELPASTHYIRVKLINSTRSTGSDQAEYNISEPMLSVAGITKYLKF